MFRQPRRLTWCGVPACLLYALCVDVLWRRMPLQCALGLLSILASENGEYYTALRVGVTVLERALYDPHQQHLSDTDSSSSSSDRVRLG